MHLCRSRYERGWLKKRLNVKPNKRKHYARVPALKRRRNKITVTVYASSYYDVGNVGSVFRVDDSRQCGEVKSQL